MMSNINRGSGQREGGSEMMEGAQSSSPCWYSWRHYRGTKVTNEFGWQEREKENAAFIYILSDGWLLHTATSVITIPHAGFLGQIIYIPDSHHTDYSKTHTHSPLRFLLLLICGNEATHQNDEKWTHFRHYIISLQGKSNRKRFERR